MQHSQDFGWLGPEPVGYSFYGGTITIFYDDAAHSYTRYEDDSIIKIPGVTSVTGIVDRSAPLMQWSSNLCSDYIASALDSNPDADAATVRGWLDKARFAHKDFKDDAATAGKTVHQWFEDYIHAILRNGGEPNIPFPEDPRAISGIHAGLAWMRAHNVQWIASERKIYSRTHDFAGTLDGLCRMSSCDNPECCGEWQRIDGRWERVPLSFCNVLSVSDWKLTSSHHANHGWQTAAYVMAIEEEIGYSSPYKELDEPIQYRAIARLDKQSGTFDAKLLPPNTLWRDKDTFVKCLALYRAINAEETQDKERRQEIRQQGKEDRDEQRKIACPKSAAFKGYRYPRCNDGDPCKTCLEKFYARHPEQKPTEDTDVLV